MKHFWELLNRPAFSVFECAFAFILVSLFYIVFLYRYLLIVGVP